MSFKLIPGLRGLGTVRTVLLAGTAATAAVSIGTSVAHAATPSPPASSTSQSPETTPLSHRALSHRALSHRALSQ